MFIDFWISFPRGMLLFEGQRLLDLKIFKDQKSLVEIKELIRKLTISSKNTFEIQNFIEKNWCPLT